MKKVFYLVIIIVAIVGFYLLKNDENILKDSPNKNYRNSTLGISFTYPKILTASTTNDIVTLHHEVPFEHHDFCDFIGEATTTIKNLTDFHVKLSIENKSLIETMNLRSPYIPQENFINGQVIESPGFIDKYAIGSLDGFKIFEGAEGCGHTIYYFPIASKKTLVITQDFITVFSGSIDVENKSKAEAVEGVINKEKEAQILEDILKTLEVR